MNDPSIIKINNINIDFIWSPLNHKYFDKEFKESIELFYKCLKSKNIKLPKFIIYEIIKFIV